MVAETNDEVHSYCEKPLASRIIEGVEYAVPVDNFKDLCCPPPPVQEVSSIGSFGYRTWMTSAAGPCSAPLSVASILPKLKDHSVICMLTN